MVWNRGLDGAARIGAQGAVLVRPDRYIAWRSQEPPRAAPPLAALREVFDC